MNSKVMDCIGRPPAEVTNDAAASPNERVVSTTAILITEYGETMIKVNKGDLPISDLFDEVIEPLLLGAGYSKELIDSLFKC